jgi:hypothetical protein
MSGVWLNLATAAGATYCWRLFGVVASRRMAADSPLMIWVRAVTTALIAALVMRFIYAPAGLLAETALSTRILALAASVGGYFAVGRRIEAGVAVAAIVFVTLENL